MDKEHFSLITSTRETWTSQYSSYSKHYLVNAMRHLEVQLEVNNPVSMTNLNNCSYFSTLHRSTNSCTNTYAVFTLRMLILLVKKIHLFQSGGLRKSSSFF
jgi:hypothetical protein